MYIKKYDFYKFYLNRNYFIAFLFKYDLYLITEFLKEIYPYKNAVLYKNFIQKPDAFSYISVFENVEITLDSKTNIIYLSDAYDDDDYRSRMKDLTTDMILQFCHDGSLDYNIMTKNNFIELVTACTQLLENQPPFALLYLEDKDWYDVKFSESEEEMKEFIDEHSKK